MGTCVSSSHVVIVGHIDLEICHAARNVARLSVPDICGPATVSLRYRSEGEEQVNEMVRFHCRGAFTAG